VQAVQDLPLSEQMDLTQYSQQLLQLVAAVAVVEQAVETSLVALAAQVAVHLLTLLSIQLLAVLVTHQALLRHKVMPVVQVMEQQTLSFLHRAVAEQAQLEFRQIRLLVMVAMAVQVLPIVILVHQ
jgi:hypothetical protein